MIRFIILFFTLVYSSLAICNDTLKSIVLDSDTHKPLAYVSIGIPSLGIGTVTNEDGEFSLSYSNKGDSLYISMIGYLPQVFCIQKEGLPSQIYLQQRPFNLDLVYITPIYVNKKHLGHKFSKRGLKLGFETNDKGFEQGVVFKLEKESLLSNISFNIAECTYKRINFRVNIYKQIDEFSFENLLNTPIYIEKVFDESMASLEIDVSEYNIVAKGKILISLEYISDLGQGDLLFYGNSVVGLPTYYRKTSFGTWNKSPKKICARLQFHTN